MDESRIIKEFTEKAQELTIVARRKSSNIVVPMGDLIKFAFELQDFHLKSVLDVATSFGCSLRTGLNGVEAAARIEKLGRNAVEPPRSLPMWAKFLLSFTAGFAPLLWVAAVLVFLSWQPLCPTCLYNLMLGIVLIMVIFTAGVFSFYQEVQASSMLDGFKTLVPTDCLVIREGIAVKIPASEVALGDLVCLETGSKIPADMRLISVSGLRVDKSMLTGESEPSKASCDPADPTISYLASTNVAFMGCNVVEGEGKGVVIAVGGNNQLAKIMSQIAIPEELTSLQQEVNRLVMIVAVLAGITAVVVVLEWAFYLNTEHHGFMTPSSMIANAIGVVVAYVPEGLPLSLSMGLTIIARRLCVEHFVLIKRLGTIETLGSISMLASDKTGTLTQNKMTVTNVVSAATIVKKELPDLFLQLTLRIAMFCNQATLGEASDKSKTVAVGSNATDRAMLSWAADNGVNSDEYRVILALPFSSATKFSAAVVRKLEDGEVYVFVKGAPEYILERCTHYAAESGAREIDEQFTVEMLEVINVESSKGRRMIAMAMIGPLPQDKFPAQFKFSAEPKPNFPLTRLTFLSCASVSDPPKESSKASVEALRRAGILVTMVTGDAASTAVAIARAVSIVTEQDVDDIRAYAPNRLLSEQSINLQTDENAYAFLEEGRKDRTSALLINGADLDTITDAAWDFIFSYKELVFARTTPEHKLLIVAEAQRRGHRVGVTGDGVNDSPALKRADVGIAMNNGSDVARDAAAIVLLNDDFAALPHAVREGRLIFENLRKVIGYQISAGSWAEVLPVLATFFLGMPQPLSSFLMIIICCFTDVYAGVALTNEPPEDEIMQQPPRDVKKRRLLDLSLVGYAYLFYANMESIGAFYMYFHYMASRGPTRAVPVPVPEDDDGQRSFPAGYTTNQLLAAWNWGLNDGALGDDETAAAAVASSVFFVGIVTAQMFHALSIRRKTPYFYHPIMAIGKFAGDQRSVVCRLWDEIACIPFEIRWPLVAAWIAAVLTTIFFNYVPVFQEWCGTGVVPAAYWAMGFGWGFLWFIVGEIRKWIIHLFPNSIIAKTAW